MATDLQTVLADNIQKELNISLVAGFLDPRKPNSIALTRLPGSHVVDEDYNGTQDVLYNFEITMQVASGDYSALKKAQEQLFVISDYLESITDLKEYDQQGQEVKKDFEFETLEVQSAPAELMADLKTVRCGLEIGVTVLKNRYKRSN